MSLCGPSLFMSMFNQQDVPNPKQIMGKESATIWKLTGESGLVRAAGPMRKWRAHGDMGGAAQVNRVRSLEGKWEGQGLE